MRWCYYGRVRGRCVAAAECTTALSFAPSRRPPALITTAPTKYPKIPPLLGDIAPAVSHRWETSHCAHHFMPGPAPTAPKIRPMSAGFDHWPLSERAAGARGAAGRGARNTRAAVFSQGAKVDSALTWIVSAGSRVGGHLDERG
jgi:hypothetical protein